ncbi:hypothetical protein BJV82DRAFT_662272 [Fennellomyces sp. T-0311]|nr:hypothetical protein BJV82DRAFT_662272 [Fennellomyces sp. T-0311]
MHRSFSSSATAAKFYKVTLTRSTIGLSKDYRAAAKTLGLVRLHQTSYQPVNPSTAGLILKLKEIVRVENVDRVPDKSETVQKAQRGYKVVGRMLQMLLCTPLHGQTTDHLTDRESAFPLVYEAQSDTLSFNVCAPRVIHAKLVR